MKSRICKDCTGAGITSRRPAPHPGPRCTSHHRAFRKAQRARAHAKRVEAVYGLAEGEYDALLAFQGGVCALCGKGFAKKRGAVDHNHKTGRVRGIIHGWENTIVGRIRDSAEWAENLAEYLRVSPAEKAGLDRLPDK